MFPQLARAVGDPAPLHDPDLEPPPAPSRCRMDANPADKARGAETCGRVIRCQVGSLFPYRCGTVGHGGTRRDTAHQLGRGGRRRCGWRMGMPVRAGRSCRPAAWVTCNVGARRRPGRSVTGYLAQRVVRDFGQPTPTQQQQNDFKTRRVWRPAICC